MSDAEIDALVEDCLDGINFLNIVNAVMPKQWIGFGAYDDLVNQAEIACKEALKELNETDPEGEPVYYYSGGWKAEAYRAFPEGYPILRLQYILADYCTDKR